MAEDHDESYEKWRAFYLERERKREKHARSFLGRLEKFLSKRKNPSDGLYRPPRPMRIPRNWRGETLQDLDEHTLQMMAEAREEHDRQEASEIDEIELESLREEGEELRFCNHCRSQIPSDSLFCKACGNSLSINRQRLEKNG